MPKSLPSPLTFYPAYCFPLSPTHNTWARLTAADIHALKERAGFEGQNLYFYLNHPIKWIRLVGIIVAVDTYPTRWIMLLDDSSGSTIEVTCGRQKPVQSTLPTENARTAGIPNAPMEGLTATGRSIDLSGIDIGSVVKLKGGIGSFRGEKQVLLERISVIYTTNEEAAAWAENTEFHSTILDVPWAVSEKDEKRAKRKAEGLDRERKAKQERRKKRVIESNATGGPRTRENRRQCAEQEKQTSEERSRAAAENEAQGRAKIKRAQERRSREQEFERSKGQEAQRQLKSKEALRKEKAQLEEAQQSTTVAEGQRHGEDLRLAAALEKKKGAESRRDKERMLRVQEYERLKARKEIGKGERSTTEI